MTLEIDLEDADDLLPDKTKRKLSVKSLEFFDEKTKKKKKVFIYSGYKELKLFGLKLKKDNGIIYKYTINLINEKNNVFLQKKFFYDKNKLIEAIKKKYNYKNTFLSSITGN